MLQPRIFKAYHWQWRFGLLSFVSFITVVQSRMQLFDLRAHTLSSLAVPTVEVYEVSRKNVQNSNYPPPPSSSTSGMRLVNVSRNSDLLFGEVTRSDSALLLQCQAPYSVQWIYRGDSDPEFNTNTTTSHNQNENGNGGDNMYSAYLYLGSRRYLNERDTGKYICTSVRNKRQYSYVYIFVTKSSLFTNKGLETIHYSRNDRFVRIPCSLSEPRATATLQKSEDGVLKCPMNDSVRFDPKQGFFINPRGINRPEGTYLCIADYDNNFQIIKYDLVFEDDSGSASGEHDPHDPSEFEPTHSPPTHRPTRPPPSTTTQPTSTESSGCQNQNCGANAACQPNRNGRAVCKCMQGYTGNPYVECRPSRPPPDSSTTTSIITGPPDDDYGSSHDNNNNNNDNNNGNGSGSGSGSGGTGYLCTSYEECPYDLACYQNRCQNPCHVNSICGPNTHCHTQNHTPICECNDGYDGDPYSSQEGQQCEQSHCNPNPCGPNSECSYVNGIIACSCKPGFANHNDGVCRPRLKVEESKVKENFAPPRKPIPRPLRNRTQVVEESGSGRIPSTPPSPSSPSSSSVKKECHYDIDCPDDKMCVHDKCEDPCINACGAGARCHTRNHFPRCVCPEGATGDPFYKCVPLFSEIIGTSSSTESTSFSTVKPEASEANEVNEINCGGKRSACGANAICQANRNYFVCACPNNYFGDPYSKRGCYAEKGYQSCAKDDDCFHFLACLRNRGCVNPCNIRHVCKPGRSCVPFMHKPTCLRTNLDGETFRDDLTVKEDEDENDLKHEDMPGAMKNSSCFVKAGEKVVSPCGRNSICYDVTYTNVVGMSETLPVCQCMVGHEGDPYVACEPLQACKNDSSCGSNQTCVNGYCTANQDDVGNGKSSLSSLCSPSPCASPEEQCAIVREKNKAICLSPGQSLDTIGKAATVPEREPLPSRFHSRTGPLCQEGDTDCERKDVSEDDEADDDLEGNTTTEWSSSDFTLIPPTSEAVSANYISEVGSSSSGSASIEDTETVTSPRYFLNNLNFSSGPRETTISVVDA